MDDSQYNFKYAPQWADLNAPSPGSAYRSGFFDEKSEDFTLCESQHSATLPSDDDREENDRKSDFLAPENLKSPYLSSNKLEIQFMHDLDTINMTPIKIVSPKSKNKAPIVLQELTLSEIKSNVFATYSQVSVGCKPRRATCIFNSTVCPSSVDNSKTPGRRVLRMNRSQHFGVQSSQTPAAKAANTPRIHVNKNIMSPGEVENITKKITTNVIEGKRTRSAKIQADEQIKENINLNQRPALSQNRETNLELGPTPTSHSITSKSIKNITKNANTSKVMVNKSAKVILTRCDAFDKQSPKIMRPTSVDNAIEHEENSEEEGKKIYKPVRISFEDMEDEKESEDEFEAQLLAGKDLFVVHQMQHPKPQAVRQKNPTFLTNPARRFSIGKKNLRRSKEYVSTAAAILSYQHDTPDRFHTVGRQTVSIPHVKPQNSRRIVPQSPKLRCAARAHRVVPAREESEAEKMSKKTTQTRPQPKRVAAIQGTSRTIPISPVLHCKTRVRRNQVLSQAEREKLELEEMRKHQIRARPVPKNILQAPAPLKPVPVKPLTSVKPFQLPAVKKTLPVGASIPGLSKQTRPTTSLRALAPLENDEMGEIEIKNFDIPFTKKKIISTVLPGLDDRNKEFLRKKEAHLKELQEEAKKKSTSQFHARPVPASVKNPPTSKTTTDKTQKSTASQVKVVPFSFADRDKKFGKKTEELRKKIVEEENKHRVFRANPAPVFKPVMVKRPSRETLKTKSVENLEEKAETRQQAETKSNINSAPMSRVQSTGNLNSRHVGSTSTNPPMSSRAKSADNLTGNRSRFLSVPDPLLGVKETEKPPSKVSTKSTNPAMPALKPSLKTLPVELHSDKRARLRREYDEMMRQKAEQEEERRNREQQAKNIREQAEIAELRKKAEIKARPMPTYRPFVLKKSNKPGTEAHSPAWATKRKH